MQGGISTGRTLTDNCEILAAVPESSPLGAALLPAADELPDPGASCSGPTPSRRSTCRSAARFRAFPARQSRRIGVIVPAQTTLGRAFTNAANMTLNLVEPGTLYGDRLNQLDIRFAQAAAVGGTRTSVNFDLYNAFNASTVLAENATYSGTRAQPVARADDDRDGAVREVQRAAGFLRFPTSGSRLPELGPVGARSMLAYMV